MQADRRTAPRALDLCCGAGGASMGLHLAGFDVTGCDLRRQPRYPFRFVQADATAPPFRLEDFDFIWASPPCQRWSALVQQRGNSEDHPDLIAPIRAMLIASGVPYCIENVPRAPLRTTVVLTGSMFGLNTYRRRHFETSFAMLNHDPGKPFGPRSRPGSVTVTGHSGGSSLRDGWTNGDRAAWQAALGIDWMTNAEMAESIPPAYARHIGTAWLHDLHPPHLRQPTRLLPPQLQSGPSPCSATYSPRPRAIGTGAPTTRTRTMPASTSKRRMCGV